ncbi:MAG: hypothetical protein CML56_06795 [Rhodobacteraceae bacterium]|nr:hypothetical protein [Paracoccaceae bacterium]
MYSKQDNSSTFFTSYIAGTMSAKTITVETKSGLVKPLAPKLHPSELSPQNSSTGKIQNLNVNQARWFF